MASNPKIQLLYIKESTHGRPERGYLKKGLLHRQQEPKQRIEVEKGTSETILLLVNAIESPVWVTENPGKGSQISVPHWNP